MSPKITVILPIYNGAGTLSEAISSILSQTERDFELLAIDDGSSDNSAELVRKFRDERIVLHQQANIGLAATLNRGIGMARSPLVARMDQDDVAMPGRFARQVEEMTDNPSLAVLGTWAQIFEGTEPTQRFHRHPTSPQAIAAELLFDNPFVHSSVMMRTAVVRDVGGYTVSPERGFPEDYDLWSRMAAKHELRNLPEVLTVYREVAGSITRVSGERIRSNVVTISSQNLTRALGQAHRNSAPVLSALYHGHRVGQLEGLRALRAWLQFRRRLSGASDRPVSELRDVSGRITRRLVSMLVRQQPAIRQVVMAIRASSARLRE